MRVLCVCLGNICRSPTALGVMRHLLAEEGLTGAVEVDSAGTGCWHAGEPPDHRATAAAAAHGIVLEGAARQITRRDFADFDLILAADRENVADLRSIAPPGTEHKIRLLREFDPASAGDPKTPGPTSRETACPSHRTTASHGSPGTVGCPRRSSASCRTSCGPR